MRILARDMDYLTRKFGAAQDFLLEAEARMECYALGMKDRDGNEDLRFGQLLNSPACYNHWFRLQLASDMKIPTEDLVTFIRPAVGDFIHIFDGDIEGCVYNVEEPTVGPKGTLRITLETEPDQDIKDMEIRHMTRDQYQIIQYQII